MPCEHHKHALIEIAAVGATPQGELRAHLDECASCRVAFDEERSLFAAIDSGLQATANPEVPSSLLPRVRVALDEGAIAHPRWSSSWLALAGAAIAALLFFAVGIRHKQIATPQINTVAVRPSVDQAIPTGLAPLLSAPSAKDVSVPTPRSLARNSDPGRKPAISNAMPEVLVPQDQEILLANYAQEWSSRKRPPLIVNDSKQADVVLLEVAPIQIPELAVKPLAEGDSQ